MLPGQPREASFGIYVVIPLAGMQLLECAAFSFSLGMKGELFLDTGARANAYSVHVDTHGTNCVHTRRKGSNKKQK